MRSCGPYHEALITSADGLPLHVHACTLESLEAHSTPCTSGRELSSYTLNVCHLDPSMKDGRAIKQLTIIRDIRIGHRRKAARQKG